MAPFPRRSHNIEKGSQSVEVASVVVFIFKTSSTVSSSKPELREGVAFPEMSSNCKLQASGWWRAELWEQRHQ